MKMVKTEFSMNNSENMKTKITKTVRKKMIALTMITTMGITSEEKFANKCLNALVYVQERLKKKQEKSHYQDIDHVYLLYNLQLQN